MQIVRNGTDMLTQGNPLLPPAQIIHSELDYRLPVTEGLSAFNVLQARKVPSKLLVFPDENHVSLAPLNVVSAHEGGHT